MRSGSGMSRLEVLQWVELALIESIEEAEADRRAPLINQLRGVLGEIEELQGKDTVPSPVSAIDEVRQRREARERQA